VTAAAPALTAPYPYFGSKRAAAPAIWSALGADVPNFVDATCGSCSVLWARPEAGKVETVNDAWGAIPNFLRALRSDPEAVAEAASWPVSELDMHARHRWLVERMDEAFVERLREDPLWCDPDIAGWWVWGQSIWIGSGWCATNHRNVHALAGQGIFRQRKRPVLAGNGLGQKSARTGPNNIAKLSHSSPHLAGCDGSGVGYGRGVFASGRREDLSAYFKLLAARLARVRIICGDWRRVVTPAVTTSHGLTGILFDPPYGGAAKRTTKLYAKDSENTAGDMRRWCAANGANPHLRIVLCGYEGEHEELLSDGWRCVPWKARGGYGNQGGENANAARERLWLSPHCLVGELEQPAQRSLFAAAAGVLS
jgi:DNA adenine methylase